VPPGFLGQIVVYKSGKAKIKLGDTLFDVRNLLLESCVRDASCELRS
jgi:hypothetical protein